MEARDGLEAEYECTSLAGPHCRTHGPTGNLFTEPEVQSEDDGSLLIQLDDATIGKDGKIDLAKVMEMFGGGVMQKAKEAAAATNEARAARAAANGDAAAANAAVEEAQAVAAKIGIGRANGAFEMHSPLAAGRRLKPDAVVGRGGRDWRRCRRGTTARLSLSTLATRRRRCIGWTLTATKRTTWTYPRV